MIFNNVLLHDDLKNLDYQVFKCNNCDKFYIYFHGKLQDLDDLVQTNIHNNEKIEHFNEGSD